jgi:hypothetical protein
MKKENTNTLKFTIPDPFKDLRAQWGNFRNKMLENERILKPYYLKLANHGWYPAPNIIHRDLIETFVLLKNDGNIDPYFVKFYSDHLKNYEETLIKNYPKREKIIKEGFIAHNSKLYFSSTLIFLTQVDGIFEGEYFKRKTKRLNSKEINKTIYSMIKGLTSVDISTTNIDDKIHKSKLNRHGIMHGIFFDYGSKLNSLKALSLLVFVDYFLVRDEVFISKNQT